MSGGLCHSSSDLILYTQKQSAELPSSVTHFCCHTHVDLHSQNCLNLSYLCLRLCSCCAEEGLESAGWGKSRDRILTALNLAIHAVICGTRALPFILSLRSKIKAWCV